MVNKFWQSVEPYCADITNEDVKILEDLLRSHENDDDYFRIPPLGKHYSEKWADEDLLEEQRDGNSYLFWSSFIISLREEVCCMKLV